MEYVTLNNGVKMPMIGFGVRQECRTGHPALAPAARRGGHPQDRPQRAHGREHQRL